MSCLKWNCPSKRGIKTRPIKEGKIENNDLTIICGPNNSGKTYVSYLFYAFISKISKNYSFNFEGVPDKNFSILEY